MASPEQLLTARQYQIYIMTLEGKQRGVIAAQLGLEPGTVAQHLARIRGVLGLPKWQRMTTLLGRGKMIQAPPLNPVESHCSAPKLAPDKNSKVLTALRGEALAFKQWLKRQGITIQVAVDDGNMVCLGDESWTRTGHGYQLSAACRAYCRKYPCPEQDCKNCIQEE